LSASVEPSICAASAAIMRDDATIRMMTDDDNGHVEMPRVNRRSTAQADTDD
jgi:hypothetical protein